MAQPSSTSPRSLAGSGILASLLLAALLLSISACGDQASEADAETETTVDTIPADPEDLAAAEETATTFVRSLFAGESGAAFALLSPAIRTEGGFDEEEFALRFQSNQLELRSGAKPLATGVTKSLAAVFHTAKGTLKPADEEEEEADVQSTITLLHESEEGWRVLGFSTREHGLGEIRDILVTKIGEGSYKIQFQHVDPQTGPGRGVIRFTAPDVRTE